MSAFTVLFEQSNTSVDSALFVRVMRRLSHRGPDGQDVLLTGHVALGRWHFWTTPEEVGERQPIAIKGLPFKIVSDCRLDNRTELISKLGIDPSEGLRLSDAALILHAYGRWGENCLKHFIGEYAFVILDEKRQGLLCARDALGERTLFYSKSGTLITIASEPWAAAGVDTANAELNETAISHFFALRTVQDGQTFFKNVYELLPAHGMWVTSSAQRSWRYWKPDPSVRLRGRSDREYAEQFLELLEQSLRSRLRSTTPIGILMSGGLDSGSLACLAARMTAPSQLTSISYVFNELTALDERSYIQTITERWGLRPIYIPCDDVPPFKDMRSWPHDPDHPEGNAYRPMKERAYERARQEGLRVLMPGTFGDELYCGEEDWLFDMFAHGHYRDATRELKRHIRYYGLRGTLNSAYAHRALRRLVNSLPGGRRLRRASPAPPWLRNEAAECLQSEESWLDPAFDNKSHILGLGASQASTYEIGIASRHALELRHPYRDRRLAEFVLSLPGYMLYNLGYYKYILRVAMQGILPHPVLSRTQSTFLSPFFMHGWNLEKQTIKEYFQNPNAAWREYVREDWLWEYLGKDMIPHDSGPSAVVVWLCVSYENWLRRLASGGVQTDHT